MHSLGDGVGPFSGWEIWSIRAAHPDPDSPFIRGQAVYQKQTENQFRQEVVRRRPRTALHIS